MTKEELIEEAAGLGGWTVKYGHIRRFHGDMPQYPECPVTAVANSRARGYCYDCAQTVQAARALGLPEDARAAIVDASDCLGCVNKPIRYLLMERLMPRWL